jgi:predicted phosphodiesterase
MLYALGIVHTAKAIGIMADSHGNNLLLASTISTLRSLGAHTLIHLGDMSDTLAPHLMNETFRILARNNVLGVRGNNECQLLHDLHSARAENAPDEPLSLLSELPYVMNLEDLWFTHSAPYSFPAATRRPISEFLPMLLNDPGIPFSILFRGHSHRPAITGFTGQSSEKIPVEMDADMALDRNRRYVITVGAVEKASSVLFLPGDRIVRFITVPRP